MSERPFRHLCPEADQRDAMDDAEFWEHVFGQPTWDDDDAGPDLDAALNVGVCLECGSSGACGYDAEGRPMIHVVPETEEEQE